MPSVVTTTLFLLGLLTVVAAPVASYRLAGQLYTLAGIYFRIAAAYTEAGLFILVSTAVFWATVTFHILLFLSLLVVLFLYNLWQALLLLLLSFRFYFDI